VKSGTTQGVVWGLGTGGSAVTVFEDPIWKFCAAQTPARTNKTATRVNVVFRRKAEGINMAGLLAKDIRRAEVT
jgi:hypothetical protein